MQARSKRTAVETFNERVGVCRDFAHLAVAFCRCLNIPAHYINGHLGDIGVPVIDSIDFSAWMEVFLDGEWHTFDPRNNVPRIGRIVVAEETQPTHTTDQLLRPACSEGIRVWTYEVASST